MMPKSPSTRSEPSAPARVAPRTPSPRWHGNPYERPPTDAEIMKSKRKQRALLRFGFMLSFLLCSIYVIMPVPVLLQLTKLPANLTPIATRIGWWLQVAHPILKYILVLLLTGVLIHLIIGLVLITRQTQMRRKATFQTMLIDLPRVTHTEFGRGVDLFAGLGELLQASGRTLGSEDVVVFGLVNATNDNKVRLAVRYPTRSARSAQLGEALKNVITGASPGTTLRPAPDDLHEAVLSGIHGANATLGTIDIVLARQPPFPLKDLAMFIGGDPLGPLATALSHHDGVSYAAYELLVRGIPAKEEWRSALREQIGQIQGMINPEDIAAHEALIRKVESYGFDVVIRCLVVGATKKATLGQLQAMQHAVQTFCRPAGDARQSLRRVGSAIPSRTPGYQCIPIAAIQPSQTLPVFRLRDVLLVLIFGLMAGFFGMTGTTFLLHLSIHASVLPIHVVTPAPVFILILLPSLAVIAGILSALSLTQRIQHARVRSRWMSIKAHAHHPVWPGYAWTLFPAPGKARSILGVYELAALWHPPSLELEAQFAWRSSKYLPAPMSAFLNQSEAAQAEVRQIQTQPLTPISLGANRLGIAYAQQRDGSLALIGPTLKDLRQGWDTLGSMGSGKSSLVETMVYEIARIGGGCGIIDAKGDLCDRLLRILPPEAYSRVIVIDTTAEIIPCINPFDRRIIRDKPRDVIAGEIGQIFARIEPEIWAGALGMQQALFMGISAILEGEPEPTLLHLERFYLSPSYREVVLDRIHDKAIRDYWLIQVPNMPEKIKTSIDSLKRRLTGLVGSETGQRLLCQPHSTIDLTKAMREQAILIIKFVPEKIGDTNAAFWGAALFQSIVSATFNQQEEPDPDKRWDWPLFVDEVQMFVKAERAEDAERMWTRTRSMGVGLIGAHQGLNQLGDTLGGIVLNVIGGMCLTSGVRDDTRDLVNAYANQGLQPEDFTGIKPREELLIRFPVNSIDMGLMSAIPRARPELQPSPTIHHLPQLPALPLTASEERSDLAALELLEEQATTMRLSHPDLLPEAIYRALANEWVVIRYRSFRQTQSDTQASDDLAWAAVDQEIRRFRLLYMRRAQHWAAALLAQPRTLPADHYLALLSQYRFGVSPLINACAVALFVHRYPTDELSLSQQERRRKQRQTTTITPPHIPGPPEMSGA